MRLGKFARLSLSILLTAGRWAYSSIVRVLVGEEACEFFVHQDLVCPRSRFFSNALKEPWQEAKERKVTLMEEDANISAVYLALLYVSVSPTSMRGRLTAAVADHQPSGEGERRSVGDGNRAGARRR